MKQAQKMQEQILAAQEELASQTFEATAGGGAIKAVVSGSQRVVSVELQKQVIDPDDPEMLGDLVVAAVNSALDKASEAADTQLGGMSGGMDLGGLLG